MATSQSIEPLTKDTNVVRWLQRFESAMEWQGISAEKKKHALLASLGADAYDSIADACLPNQPSAMDYASLCVLIKSQLQPTKLPIAARYEFFQIKQNDKDVKTYVRMLQHAAADCAFGNQLEDRIRDQLVFGLSNKDAVKKMLTEALADLTLKKAIEIASSYEAVQESQKKLLAEPIDGKATFAVKKNFPSNINQKKEFQGFRSKPVFQKRELKVDAQKECLCCGKKGHLREVCFFRNQKCHVCQKIGHIKAVCRNGSNKIMPKKSVHTIENNDDVLFNIGSGLYRTVVNINGRRVSMIFDTGSEVSIINENVFEALGGRKKLNLVPRKHEIKAYNGNSIPILGTCLASVTDNNQESKVSLLVSAGQLPCIYGCDMITKFRPAFSINAIKNATVSLTLKEEAVPKFVRPRQIAYGLLEPIKKEINRLVKENILIKVDESDWATPIVPVLKPDGSIRLCGDYKVTLNPCLQNMISTTRSLEDIINSMQGSKWFSELDLRNAYHQLPLDYKSSMLTTLSTPFGLFRHAFLPFGIKTSPAIFQNAMENLLSDINGIEIYQDNIYVHAKTKIEHDRLLQLAKQRLESKKFVLNYKKCKLNVKELKVLGTVIDGIHAKPDPEKVKAINEMKVPNNVKEVRSFLGMIEFYGRFIHNLSTIKEPLTRLTRKETKFVWSETEQRAFSALKDSLCNVTMLNLFNQKYEITLICDASPIACAAVLQQNGKPVLFASKTLSSAERNYSHLEREALAIVWAVRRLHKYLIGRHFTLLTDNQPIKFIFDTKKAIPTVAAARIQRWALFLMNYDFTIQHIKGTKNEVADCLSRNIYDQEHEKTFDINAIQSTFHLPIPVNIELIRKMSSNDSTIQELMRATQNGWKLRDIKKGLKEYSAFRHEFNQQNDLLFRGNRLVIPSNARSEILKYLHEGHPGITAMKGLARQCVWWLKIDKDIELEVKRCTKCLAAKGSAQSSWLSWPVENEPWSRVHIDFAGPLANGQYALIIVDAFSKWPEIHTLPNITTSETIKRLRRTFAQEGVPSVLVCDNGPSLISTEMKQWLSIIGCRQILTPPYHPRSNGLAERFVRTYKEHLRADDSSDIQAATERFLLSYRNTPHSTTGQPPSMLLKGRLLRTKLTALANLKEEIYVKDHRSKDKKWKKAIILGREGERIVKVKDEEDRMQRYHIEDTKDFAGEKQSKEIDNKKVSGEKEIEEQKEEGGEIKTRRQLRPREMLKPPDRYTG